MKIACFCLLLLMLNIQFVNAQNPEPELDRELFGIHKSVSSGSYSFVKYHIGGPDFDVILDFDAALGDIWELAFNTQNKLFYTYGKASYNTPSVLLEINASTATVTNLGEISVSVGNNTYTAICTTDGLTFNQTTNELIGTVDIDCGSWRAFRVIKFNLNSFSSGSVSSTQLGTLNNPSNLEFDAMAMANNNVLQGMDPDIPTNSLKYYSVQNVTSSLGQTNVHATFNNWSQYRGIAFNKSDDLMFTFAGQNGMRWLVSCQPSYGSNPFVFQNVTEYNLMGFEIRGIVFGAMAAQPLSIDEHEIVISDSDGFDELELLIYPNPSSGIVSFNFDGEHDFKQIQLMDAHGKLVYTANQQEISARKVDLRFLSEGVYLIHVFFDNGKSKVVRLVKHGE